MRFQVSVLILLSCVFNPACSPGEVKVAPVDPPAGQSAPPEAHVATEDLALIEQGRLIAERECQTCHAADDQHRADGRPDAPSLAELLGRYDEEALVNHLVDGVKLGHEDMPLFDFNVIAADALVAYLKSIRPSPDAPDVGPG